MTPETNALCIGGSAIFFYAVITLMQETYRRYKKAQAKKPKVYKGE